MSTVVTLNDLTVLFTLGEGMIFVDPRAVRYEIAAIIEGCNGCRGDVAEGNTGEMGPDAH